MPLHCIFCGATLPTSACVWVQLPDGKDFVCCPTVCDAMAEAIEARRRQVIADRLQIALPLDAA